jgi:hypothetical protein
VNKIHGLCSHCQLYIARPKTGKCIVCSASPLTKKEIKEARIKLGIEEPPPPKKTRKKREKKAEKPIGPKQSGLFGDTKTPPPPPEKESRKSTKQSKESGKESGKKNRRTARKKRTHINSQRDENGNIPKKGKYKSPVSDAHITEYFKILAAKSGARDWME